MPIQNIHRARQNLNRHPWAQQLVDTWRRDTAYARQQDRPFFDDLIPILTPWPEYGQNCPACVNTLSSMGETGLYQWDIRAPDRLTCKYCRTSYPNEAYPETGTLTAPRMGQTFAYYLNDAERAHPDDTTGTHAYRWVTFPVHTSWSGILRSKQGYWCLDQVLPLAWIYALTGDLDSARRAAWILDIFARRYPGWLFHSYDGTYADCPPAEAAAALGRHPRGGRFAPQVIRTAFAGRHRDGDHAVLFNGFWGAGRFSCSGGDAGMLLKLTLAYELIVDARDADGQPLLDPETDRRIRADLIEAGCDDMEHWDEINNKCGPARALSALVGRLCGRPQSVRRAIDGFEGLLEKGFHADGCCTESPSYSDMFLNLMRPIPDLLAGYSDPEGYVPDAGERLQDFAPYARFGRYRLALEGMLRILDPDLRYPVIGDTHAGAGLQPIHAEVLAAHYGAGYAGLLQQIQGAPLEQTGGEYALWHRDPDLQATSPTPLPRRSEWFPAWHVGVLRGGDPDGHTALYFNGYAQGGHRHADTLGISYIAHRTELAADRGYIWDDPRGAWTKGTLSHNLVTVDGQNQNHPDRRSALELFGQGSGLEVIEASAQAYAQCDQYRRCCVLLQRPDGGSYAVDFFRVVGGGTHHYGFHCNGRLAGAAGADWAPLQGPEPTLEAWLQWVDSPRTARPTAPFKATWDHDGTRLDLHLLNDIDRLLLADAPGWRSCHGSQLTAPPVQQLLAEHQGPESAYVAVMVPYTCEASPVRAARLLPAPDGALAVEVRLAERTDYLLLAPDQEPRTCGPLTLAGRFGYLALDADGQPLQAYMLDATRLACGDLECTLPRGRTPLDIAAVDDRTLHLARPLPRALPPIAALHLGDSAYDVEALADDRIRVRDYPLADGPPATLVHHLPWSR